MIVRADKEQHFPQPFAFITKGLFSLVLIFLLCSTGHTKAESQNSAAAEYAVKAAYIYNILRFVNWPETSPLSKTDSLNICLYKTDPFDRYMDPIRKKSVGKKQIKLKTINKASESDLCHLIFISNKNDFKAIITDQSFKHSDSILLGNDIEFVKEGGVFSFYIENNKVRLVANKKAIANAEFKISSLLIEVCKLHGEEP